MAEKREDMGAVTHQLSAVDDDNPKSGVVKEANVASVALGMSSRSAVCFAVCSWSSGCELT